MLSLGVRLDVSVDECVGDTEGVWDPHSDNEGELLELMLMDAVAQSVEVSDAEVEGDKETVGVDDACGETVADTDTEALPVDSGDADPVCDRDDDGDTDNDGDADVETLALPQPDEEAVALASPL